MNVYNAALCILVTLFLGWPIAALENLTRVRAGGLWVFAVVVALLSMAGVPPLAGFFTKVLVLLFLLQAGYGLWFTPFLLILLLGLWFYVQNVRFLYAADSHQRRVTLRAVISPRVMLVVGGLCCAPLFFVDGILWGYWLLS